MTAPFLYIPSGIEIAHWFFEHHSGDWVRQGCDGFSLYREGNDYCYLWVEAYVDHDLAGYWLLDIRTATRSVNAWETRDYLFVGNRPYDSQLEFQLEVEWHNQPLAFNSPSSQHQERFVTGMKWFAERIVDAHKETPDND